MADPTSPSVDAAFANKLRLDSAQRHAFLCMGPDCCSEAEGLPVWEALKSAIKEKGVCALRTKAACLRVCAEGPWMVVYPEGTWYSKVTVETCQTIVEQHLRQGRPVEALAVRTHPLPKVP